MTMTIFQPTPDHGEIYISTTSDTNNFARFFFIIGDIQQIDTQCVFDFCPTS
jgi:hypothetical protein